MKTLLRDLRWILPASLGLGLIVSLLGPGTWWIGWLAYAFVLALGLLAINALWRSTGASRTLMLMLVLAGLLRLGLGIAFSTLLPRYGNNTFINQAGYAVRDAYSYDTEAWKLASSGDPLWKAFDRSYKSENQYDDQYGGLLFFHSLFYRFLSPDAHRPGLIILFSALAGAIGVALAWKGARQSWGERTAWILGWIMALYPESLLAGASAVREPFLIMFIAMAFWGMVDWLASRDRKAWIWLAGSLLGMALFSPGVVIVTLIGLGIWAWLRRYERPISLWWFAGAAGMVVLAALFLGVLVGGTLQVRGGPLMNLINWLRLSVKYGTYLTVLNSGWIQIVVNALPAPLHLPFIIGYGIAQPVLPAAIADPTAWPMWVLNILRGLGWYALIPLLLYSLRSIWKITDKRDRLAWLWLWLVSWIWIMIAAARAGGDQWDNPRYRVILLLFQAVLAAQALTWQRLTRDRWLGRILAAEGVFLVIFGYWYASRYWLSGLPIIPIFAIFGAIVVFCGAIFLGGWVWDRRKNGHLSEK
jgi:hypothetical protein